MSTFLILGASGTVGSQIVNQLKAKGHKVVRTTSQKVLKPDQVHFNIATQEGLSTLFDGIDKAFFLSPPGYTNQDELLTPLIKKAKEKGLQKVVLMTAMGANSSDELPMRKAEIALEKSGLTYNIIRPNWFMQNFNSYWVQGIKADQKIYLSTGKAAGSFIDARDIASSAVSLLESDTYKNQDFDLTGSQSLNHDEVAAILSQVTGKKITYQDISADAMYDGLIKAGLPENYARFMIIILNAFKEGYSARVTDSVEKLTGRKPITFEQYAKDYKNSWT